jgi:hypothetical protein
VKFLLLQWGYFEVDGAIEQAERDDNGEIRAVSARSTGDGRRDGFAPRALVAAGGDPAEDVVGGFAGVAAGEFGEVGATEGLRVCEFFG